MSFWRLPGKRWAVERGRRVLYSGRGKRKAGFYLGGINEQFIAMLIFTCMGGFTMV